MSTARPEQGRPGVPARVAAALSELLGADGLRPSGLCVALSGGLDSSVLLAALARRPAPLADLPLRAIHVDHGLQPAAADWARHCARVADVLGVPFAVLAVDAGARRGESPEAVARAARYAALGAALAPQEVLLTAHHADDQLETVLLQCLRGGGLRALAGMPALARFGRGWHARPLLGCTRVELESWAASTGLEWCQDSSNLDARYDRNYLRLEVLPTLRRRWPAAAFTVSRVARQAGAALALDEAAAARDLAAVVEGSALSLECLARLEPEARRRALRAWLRAQGRPVPSAATLESLLLDAGRAAADRVPETRWPGAVVRRYRGRLYAASGDDPNAPPSGQLAPGEPLDLGALGRLELRASQGSGLSRTRLPAVLEVGARGAGAAFLPAGAASRRPLRKWLQERGVLPWLRPTLPLLSVAGRIVAVGDLACGGGLEAAPGEPSWTVVWHGRPLLTEREALDAPLAVAAEGAFR